MKSDLPKVTPAQTAQLRQLQLHQQHHAVPAVNLNTVAALIRKGLVTDSYGDGIKQGCRLAGAYPITELGEQYLAETPEPN